MFHLGWFGTTGPVNWLAPTGTMYDWRKPEIYQDVAKLCERAKMDFVMFADSVAIPSLFRGSTDYYVRNGFMIYHDPVPTCAWMAAATQRIGLASTLSCTFYPPYLLARLLGTMDHLSSGRIAWNVVTSTKGGENFGMEMPEHDERYDMADEYLDLCRQLWDSWAPDAVVMDRENRIFADPAKVRTIDFKGQHYQCRGPLNVVSSPQKHPVIIMAGTSPRGQRFAVQNADMVIAHKNSVADMKSYSAQLRQKAADAGRDPKSLKIFYAIKPVMGDTPAEAEEKWQRHLANGDVDLGLADLSNTLMYDMSQFDLDKPLPKDLKVQGIVGKLLQYTQSQGHLTLREIAKHESLKETFPIHGTPDQIADVLEHAWREGGADGFHFRQMFQDYGYLVEIATKLVPVLQKRSLVRKEYSGTMLRDHLFEF